MNSVSIIYTRIQAQLSFCLFSKPSQSCEYHLVARWTRETLEPRSLHPALPREITRGSGLTARKNSRTDQTRGWAMPVGTFIQVTVYSRGMKAGKLKGEQRLEFGSFIDSGLVRAWDIYSLVRGFGEDQSFTSFLPYLGFLPSLSWACLI